jgi:hypothetical protein
MMQAKRHHALSHEDGVYQKLMEACLNNFMIFGPKKSLREAFAIACQLQHIYQALSYSRLMFACDKADLHTFYGHGRLSWPLTQFMMSCRLEDR